MFRLGSRHAYTKNFLQNYVCLLEVLQPKSNGKVLKQDFKSFMQSLWVCSSKEQLQRTFKIDIQTKIVTKSNCSF